jgi:hypothetical protein
LGDESSAFRKALSNSEAGKWAYANDNPVRKERIWNSLQRDFGIHINSNLECNLTGEIQMGIQGIEDVLPFVFEAGNNYDLGIDELKKQEQFKNYIPELQIAFAQVDSVQFAA